MKTETIFVKDRLLAELLGGIEDAAAKMDRVGQLIKARTSLTWSVPLAWVILKSPAVRKHLSGALTLTAGELRQLECSAEERGKIAELMALAKKGRLHIVEDFAKIDAASDFADLKNVSTYLRTGAIIIDKAGKTTVAKNAKELLTDYCSVTVRTADEAAFVAKVREMQNYENEIQAAREKLAGAHREFVKLAKSRQGAALEHCQRSNGGDFDGVTLSDEIRLSNAGAIWRALITFMKSDYDTYDGPHFYNRIGIPAYDVEQVYNLTGYRPEATPALRYRFPKLYENVAYRGELTGLYDDTPNGYAAFKADADAGKQCADCQLVYNRIYI